jgi:integrase
MIETAVHIAKRRNPSGKVCYTVRWFQDGHYRGHACGPHKETAYEYRRQKRWELKQGISEDICAVSWERFVAEHVANILGKNHGDQVRQTLNQFGEMFHPSGPHALSFGMVEEFQRRLRVLKEGVGGKLLSPHTINGKLRRLKHALNMAVERRHIRRNPMGKRFRFESVEELDPVQVPDEWKQAVLDACPTLTWKAFLYLLTTTGCRRGEILGLAWEQVHLEGAFIRLTETKARRVRLQPLVPSAVALLGQLYADAPKMVDGGREVPKEPLVFRALKFNVNREFDRIRDRATLDDGSPLPFFRMKDLRSTAGTDAADEQFSEFNVASFLGHADSKVTAKHYIKRKLDAKRQIAEALASKLNIA